MTKMTYGKREGILSALVHFDDGRIFGFVYKDEDCAWHTGGDAAIAFTKSAFTDADLMELGALPPLELHPHIG